MQNTLLIGAFVTFDDSNSGVATNGIANGDEISIFEIGAVVWAMVGAMVGAKVGAVVLIGAVGAMVFNGAVVIGAVVIWATVGAKVGGTVLTGAIIGAWGTFSTVSGWTGDGEMGDFVVDEKIFSAQPRTAASLRQVIWSNLSSSRSSTTQI